MSKLIDELINMGCDMNVTMDRFMNDEEFYMDCYKQLICDKEFDNLKIKLEQHDIKGAFDSAHTLKGVCANMGIKSLYDIIVEIVETLRSGNDNGLLDKYVLLMNEKEKYAKLTNLI